MPKPDFLCIGAQKAGTRWLYDQLASHPDVWMPPVKELHFFDRGVKQRDKRRAWSQLRRVGRAWLKRQAPPERDTALDLAFLMRRLRQPRFESARAAEIERHYPGYRRLFDLAGDRLTGDITPDYCQLDDSRVASIARHFPGLKIILLLREPTARLWSHANMLVRRGRVSESDLRDPVRFRAHFCGPRAEGTSFLSRTHRIWSAHFDAEHYAVFYFDDVASRPDRVLDRLACFLGLGREGFRIADSYNRKAEFRRIPIPPEIEALCREHFAGEYAALAAELGDHATTWLARARAADSAGTP